MIDNQHQQLIKLDENKQIFRTHIALPQTFSV
jgi:hypothetical protein